MTNEQLIKDIKHFEYVTKNKYEIMENLLKKGYPESQIIEEFDNYSFKSDWKGNILGFFMIGLAVLIGFSVKSTFGSFNYEFDSRGDFLRLSEWVFKPFLILSLFFTGVNSIINKGFINKNTRLIMIIAFILFFIICVASVSHLSSLFGVLGIIIFSLYKTSIKNNFSSSKILIESIKNGNVNQKSILRKISVNDGEKWKGSSVFLFLLLAFSFFINSPIDLTREIVSQIGSSIDYKVSLQTIDIILIYGLKTLIILSFLISIFLAINLNKFKVLLFGIMLLSGIYSIITFFHSNFQTSIFPALLIVLAGIITINQKKLFTNKV